MLDLFVHSSSLSVGMVPEVPHYVYFQTLAPITRIDAVSAPDTSMTINFTGQFPPAGMFLIDAGQNSAEWIIWPLLLRKISCSSTPAAKRLAFLTSPLTRIYPYLSVDQLQSTILKFPAVWLLASGAQKTVTNINKKKIRTCFTLALLLAPLFAFPLPSPYP